MQMKMVVIKMVVRQWERDQPRITRIARMYANGVVSNGTDENPGSEPRIARTRLERIRDYSRNSRNSRHFRRE